MSAHTWTETGRADRRGEGQSIEREHRCSTCQTLRWLPLATLDSGAEERDRLPARRAAIAAAGDCRPPRPWWAEAWEAGI